MSKQQYVWMLGLISAWRQLQQCDSDQDDSFPSRVMEEVTAVAGRLRAPEREAANDMAAALFILVLLLWWCGAKNRANFCESYPVMRKINEPPIFRALPRTPHQMAAPWLWLLLWPVPNQSPPHKNHVRFSKKEVKRVRR